MKILVTLFLFLIINDGSIAGEYEENRKKCLLENFSEKDNDRSTEIIGGACNYISRDNPSEFQKKRTSCIFKNINKAADENYEAAEAVARACKFISGDNPSKYNIFYSECILENIEKASKKNTRAAKLIGWSCTQYAKKKEGVLKDEWTINKYKCILKNISKAKSDSSADKIGDICS